MIGKRLYGDCDGYFGNYNDATRYVLAYGDLWLVTTDEAGIVSLANFINVDDMVRLIDKWSKNEYSSF